MVLAPLVLAAVLFIVGAGAAKASAAVTIEGKVMNKNTTVECAEASGNGRREGSLGATTITLSGCSANVEGVKPACQMEKTLTLQAKTELVEVGGTLYEKLTAANSKYLLQIYLKECVSEGKYNLTGTLASPTEAHEGGKTVGAPLTFSAATNAAAGVTVSLAGNPATVTGSAGRTLAVEGNGAKQSSVPLKWRNSSGVEFPSTGRTPKMSGGPFEFLSGQVYGLSVTCQSVEAFESQLGGSGEHFHLKFSGCSSPEHPSTCYPTFSAASTGNLTATTVGFGGQVHQVLSPVGKEPVINIPLSNCTSSSLRLSGTLANRYLATGWYAAGQPVAFSPWIDSEAGAGLTDQFGAVGTIRGMGMMELNTGEAFGAA